MTFVVNDYPAPLVGSRTDLLQTSKETLPMQPLWKRLHYVRGVLSCPNEAAHMNRVTFLWLVMLVNRPRYVVKSCRRLKDHEESASCYGPFKCFSCEKPFQLCIVINVFA